MTPLPASFLRWMPQARQSWSTFPCCPVCTGGRWVSVTPINGWSGMYGPQHLKCSTFALFQIGRWASPASSENNAQKCCISVAGVCTYYMGPFFDDSHDTCAAIGQSRFHPRWNCGNRDRVQGDAWFISVSQGMRRMGVRLKRVNSDCFNGALNTVSVTLDYLCCVVFTSQRHR